MDNKIYRGEEYFKKTCRALERLRFCLKKGMNLDESLENIKKSYGEFIAAQVLYELSIRINK